MKLIRIDISNIAYTEKKVAMDSFLDLIEGCEKLLFETWHDRHEDIVDVISQHGNASSIPSLIKCLDMNLDCMKYNNSYSFHKKIIHAIQNLDGKNYKNHLKLIFQKLSPKLRAELKK